MKSLHIFRIIVVKRREIPRVTLGKWKAKSHLGMWKAKSQMKPKGQLRNSIYVTFSFERKAGTSPLILSIDRLMRTDCSPHSL